MMELRKAIWERRTIRKFKDKKIPVKVLKEIFSAGLQAPSACNQQRYEFIIIDDELLKEKIKNNANFLLIKNIPSPVLILCDKRYNKENNANIQSVSATIQNMLLYAYSLGIGSWWINEIGDRNKISKILNIPSFYEIVACIGFGYPKEKPIKPKKRDTQEITHINYLKKEKKNLTSDPDSWSNEELIKFAELSISAKSPEIGYFPLFQKEFDNIVDYVSKFFKKKNLNIYDISGIYIFELAKLNKDKNFLSISESSQISNWLKKRSESLHLKNTEFEVNTLKKIKNNSYESILALDVLNRVSLGKRKEIIYEIKRILKPRGTSIISLINSKSLYGFLMKKGIERRFGPEISLPLKQIKNIIKNNNLKIIEQRGFNIIPSLKFINRTGVPKKYKFFGPLLKRFTNFNMLESFGTKSFFKNFCRLNILVIRK